MNCCVSGSSAGQTFFVVLYSLTILGSAPGRTCRSRAPSPTGSRGTGSVNVAVDLVRVDEEIAARHPLGLEWLSAHSATHPSLAVPHWGRSSGFVTRLSFRSRTVPGGGGLIDDLRRRVEDQRVPTLVGERRGLSVGRHVDRVQPPGVRRTRSRLRRARTGCSAARPGRGTLGEIPLATPLMSQMPRLRRRRLVEPVGSVAQDRQVWSSSFGYDPEEELVRCTDRPARLGGREVQDELRVLRVAQVEEAEVRRDCCPRSGGSPRCT